jgi:pyridoxamine 5'-phosphate oxidase
MVKNQRDTRRDYGAEGLRRAALQGDPLDQFERWFTEAVDAGLADATAMALATAGADGQPAVRIVLLKHFDHDGFCWYTDYRSAKGRELAENPRASCLFHWRELDRQVRLSGPVTRIAAADATAYFATRPADSRFSAAASRQSAVVPSRDELESRVAELRRQHPDGDVPRPEQWGGYRLQPECYEFWQGRTGRLHDRFRYTRHGDGWQIERLQP